MYILAIDTTYKFSSVAIGNGTEILSYISGKEEMNHLKSIISIIDDSLKKAGITIAQIDRIAVTVGPGSFTGIRIGISVARAIAQALNLQVYPVSTLKTISIESEFEGYICPIINARRKQVYGGLYKKNNGMIVNIIPEKQYMLEDLIEEIKKLKENVVFTGDGVDEYKDIIFNKLDINNIILEDENTRYQNAKGVLNIISCGNISPVSYNKVIPDYMRKTEAEIRLANNTLGKKQCR